MDHMPHLFSRVPTPFVPYPESGQKLYRSKHSFPGEALSELLLREQQRSRHTHLCTGLHVARMIERLHGSDKCLYCFLHPDTSL